MKEATDCSHQGVGEALSSPVALPTLLAKMAGRCTDCRACVRLCAFLQQHGSPASIAAAFIDTAAHRQMAYACSLCGLCAAVCPENLDPCALFLEMRRRQVATGSFDARPYRPLLVYERLGRARLLSWFGLPTNCTTVFFPGCALPGTRPAVTLRLFQHLRQQIPNLGMALHCCTKPSHDLGRSPVFAQNFHMILQRFREQGISTVLTACPNCTRMFREYGQELQVETVFNLLHEHGNDFDQPANGQEICVHDPCPLRGDRPSQEAARGLLRRIGYTVQPMRHQHQNTLCCGEGGAVGFHSPELARTWSHKRVAMADGRKLVTTCAGCTALLGARIPTLHLADLLFPPPPGSKAEVPARPPMTYLNRLLLKLRLRRHI